MIPDADRIAQLTAELERTKAELADARASLAQVRHNLDEMIGVHDEVEADHDAERAAHERTKVELARAEEHACIAEDTRHRERNCESKRADNAERDGTAGREFAERVRKLEETTTRIREIFPQLQSAIVHGEDDTAAKLMTALGVALDEKGV